MSLIISLKRSLKAYAHRFDMYCTKHVFFSAFLLTLLAFNILLLRNLDPYLHPVIYAEDGVFTSLGLTKGWLHAFFHSRPDYVFGIQIIFLSIATTLSGLIGNSPLKYLPETIAIISFLYYSLVAVFIFYTVRHACKSQWAGALSFLIILWLPLGESQNEIFGRLLQLHFYMPLLAILFIYWRDRTRNLIIKIALNLGLIICLLSNPMIFIVLAGYCAFVLFKRKFCFDSWLNIAPLSLAMASYAIYIYPRILQKNVESEPLLLKPLIEIVLARSIEFPIVFSYYRHLSDISVAFIFAIYCFIVVKGFKNARLSDVRWIMIALSCTLIITNLLMVFSRPSLSHLFNNYSNTFPDRYFMGQNALSALLLVISLWQIISTQRQAYTYKLLLALLLLPYVIFLGKIFDFSRTRMNIYDGKTFLQQVCEGRQMEQGGLYQIQIYPKLTQFEMLVPERYISPIKCE